MEETLCSDHLHTCLLDEVNETRNKSHFTYVCDQVIA
jgi:hypothetical protein